MIHHVSISARDPKHVAEVLAELMGGRALPVPWRRRQFLHGGQRRRQRHDDRGLSRDVTLLPGTGDGQARAEYKATAGYVPFHLLLSVPVDRATVERIGEREGWRTKYFGRGAPGQPPCFHVIEFWVENRLMIEVATPDMVEEYTRMIRLDALDAHFGNRAAA